MEGQTTNRVRCRYGSTKEVSQGESGYFQGTREIRKVIGAFQRERRKLPKAYKSYNECIKKCVEDTKKPECIAVIGDTLCVISKSIVYSPQDGDLADVIWKVTELDGKPPKEGIEIPMYARPSFADGSPVGRGEITYGGSKIDKDGLLILHWNVSPDYRVIVKPADAEGSGATMTIEPQ